MLQHATVGFCHNTSPWHLWWRDKISWSVAHVGRYHQWISIKLQLEELLDDLINFWCWKFNLPYWPKLFRPEVTFLGNISLVALQGNKFLFCPYGNHAITEIHAHNPWELVGKLQHACFSFMRYRFRISARRLSGLIEIFHTSCLSLQAHAETVPYNRPRPFQSFSMMPFLIQRYITSALTKRR
jgi:hypothetical protein